MARRKNGTGSIRLRADGRWEGRYVVGYDDKGYPKTKCVLAKAKTDCLQKLKALKESCEEQKPSKVQAGCAISRLAGLLVPELLQGSYPSDHKAEL